MKKTTIIILACLAIICTALMLTGCGGDGKISDFTAVYKSSGSVVYSWQASGADRFEIFESDTADGTFTKTTTTTEKTFTAPNKETFYRIKSIKGGEQADYTKPFSYLYSYFGDNTRVFTPDHDQDDIQDFIDEYYSVSAWDQQGVDRLSMLFMPGVYDKVDMHIGYYTSVSGLGYFPSDVTFKALHTFDHPTNNNGAGVNTALSNFWRTMENVTLNQNSLWSVCQATSLRRVHAKANLELAGLSWSSGGYIADSRIDGTVYARSQQQWFTRNSYVKTWSGVNINMVFAGVEGGLPGAWSASSLKNTVLEKTEVIRDKPFIVFDEQDGYGVFLPDERYDAAGYSWKDDSLEGEFISINKFYIADSSKDTAATINKALSAGKHLILSPGMYELDKAIEVTKPNTIVMGMGLATLQLLDSNDDTALRLADVDGLNVSSILFKSGEYSDSMLEVGPDGASKDHSANPTRLADLFFCSGAIKYEWTDVDITLKLNSHDVQADHFWLWRADHGFNPGDRTMRLSWTDDWNYDTNKNWKWKYEGNTLFDEKGNWPVQSVGGWEDNGGRVGIEVNGDRVSIYGLFVEHYKEYQTIWNGEDGFMCFYQSETPYEMIEQSQWMREGGTAQSDQGWASYYIPDHVQNHTAYGLGIYLVKRDTTNQVMLDHAIEAPSNPGIKIIHMITAKLGTSHPQDGIRYIINNRGSTATSSSGRPGFTSFIGGVYTA